MEEQKNEDEAQIPMVKRIGPSKRFLISCLMWMANAFMVGTVSNVLFEFDSSQLRYLQAGWTPETIVQLPDLKFLGFLAGQIGIGIFWAWRPKTDPTKVFGYIVVSASIVAIATTLYTMVYHEANLGDFIFYHQFGMRYRQIMALTMPIRFLSGALAGSAMPTCFAILQDWAPATEHSYLASIALSGGYVGLALGPTINMALLNLHGPKEGQWAAPLAAYGIGGLMWFLIWHKVANGSPEDDPVLSPTERKLVKIRRNRQADIQIRDLMRLATSLSLWVFIWAFIGRTWGFFILPFADRFIMEMFGAEQATQVPLIHALAMAISLPLGGQLADMLVRSGIVSLQMCRKIFFCGGLGLTAIFYVVLSQIFYPDLAILLLLLSGVSMAFATAALWATILDLATGMAPLIVSLCGSFGAVTSIALGFNVLPRMFNASPDGLLWDAAFPMLSAGLLSTSVAYAVLGSNAPIEMTDEAS